MDVPTASDVGTCPHRHEVIKAFGEVSDPVLVDLASMGAR
jgi:hypothetical protein